MYGGQVNRAFIKYTARLTGKSRPNICFLPTALADNDRYISYWYELCTGLNLIPHVMRVWVSSHSDDELFEDIIMSMDAIIVGGGNTLNMLGIWKAQGIDQSLKKAYESGIVLAGGSAGSICWFNGGNTDSRPKQLSIVRGLHFLDYSHCPHYSSEKTRRPLYHQQILAGNLSDGYACDDLSGIIFVNGKAEQAVSRNTENNSYFVYKDGNKIIEEQLEAELIG